jgi:hypothetical protein
MKYTRGVLAGKYKGDDLFASVLQAMVLKRDKQERGVGMQNFKYTPDLVEFAHIIHTHSPKAYEFLRDHLPLPDSRTIKYASLRIGVNPLTWISQASKSSSTSIPCWDHRTNISTSGGPSEIA